MRAVARGETWLTDEIAQQVALVRVCAQEPTVVLTQRECEVVKRLAKGQRVAEIAKSMEVSLKTVNSLCAALRRKLNARTSSEMVRIAIKLQLG